MLDVKCVGTSSGLALKGYCAADLSYERFGKEQQTLLLRGNPISNTGNAAPKLGLRAAQLGKRRGELGQVLGELILELGELWRGDGGEIDSCLWLGGRGRVSGSHDEE